MELFLFVVKMLSLAIILGLVVKAVFFEDIDDDNDKKKW